MGKLLSDSRILRRNTAAEKMSSLLDRLEDGFLHGKEQERSLVKKLGRGRNVIDISSAATMQLLHVATGPALAASLRRRLPALLDRLEAYPYLVPREHDLEQAFAAYLRRWTSLRAEAKDLVVFNGIYGSYRTILMSQPGQYVLVPEFIHQTHKAAFAAAGKTVVEIPVTAGRLLDV
ncbi:MAG TPA: hypothetical protein VHA30_02865, partial [Patescibacteria group bacterium]|nr:hypothetical protein [Patescibacteria group bacterium]